MGIDNPVHLIFLAAVALLVLGPRRLPEVARSLGKGIREFREAMSDGSAGEVAPPPEQPPLAQVVDPVEPVRSGDAPDRRPL
jgi:sec-independent protein translocase protein TatA